jgi:putative ABC transport system permease protein
MMKWQDNLYSALTNISLSKIRSMLTVLGILIGTGSVVALLLSGQLATEHALSQFKVLGTNLLSIEIQQNNANGVSNTNAPRLTIDQTMTSQGSSSAFTAVAPYVASYTNISYNVQNLNGSVIGTTDSLAPILKVNMLSGRFISVLDKDENYAVIGFDIYQQLQKLGAPNPLGKQIPINNVVFTIVGIMQSWPENSFFPQNLNSSVIIPLQTLLHLDNTQRITNIVYQFQGQHIDVDAVQNNLTQYFQSYLPHSTLLIRSPQQMIVSMEAQSRTFNILLGVIGSISLLVGGIGVMNMMLVSVVQRRLEIGIRRAVGARQSDILELFLFEAVVLSLIGGILGIFLGLGTAAIIATYAHWEFHMFWFPPIIGFLVSTLVGIICGFYPATRAARLNPILILRH